MSSTQPRKKRRIGSLNSVPLEILPLVSPNQVPKSSKDPNRGMYPRKTSRSKKEPGDAFPAFNTASQLLNDSCNLKTPEVIASTSAKSTISSSTLPRKSPRLENESGQNTYTKPSGKSSQKKKFPVVSFANKIISYFKPSASASPKKNDERTLDIKSSHDVPMVSSSKNKIDTALKRKNEVDKLNLELKNETFFKKFRDCYGLFGTNDAKDERKSYFESLPRHLLESILCQIPILDLMSCRLVCRRWNYTIKDEHFMRWKKLYYGVKTGEEEPCEFLMKLCQAFELTIVEDCFGVLIRYMSEDFRNKPSEDMCKLLLKDPKAVSAEIVLAERFPEVLTRDSKAWCIFATAMLLSETVTDICNLYDAVATIGSGCPLPDITNAMYCVATFLLHFRNVHGINHGLHYRVYSALYWIENNLPSKDVEGAQTLRVAKGLPGQQSIHSYCETSKPSLTYEQLRILNHCFQPNQILKIVALAGTGKTTTLIHLAQLYPQVKFLNVMFNKAVCEDAKKRFPSNVTCKTAHSLAWATHGSWLRHKLTTKIRPHDLVTSLNHNNSSRLQIHSYAKHVQTAIENFVASADSEISLCHVPELQNDTSYKVISDDDKNRILKDARQIWEKMIDRNNKDLRITHDTYLKLHQLSKPKLTDYQCLMVDEAQDCNPAMLDVMMSQNLPVILVGDPNQQIYGFRGANNALQSITATYTYHLTKSFRFGPEIAYIASCCLEVLKLNTKDTLVGSDKASYVDGTVEGQYTIIARTNVQLFNEAVRLCCLKRFRDNEPNSVQGAFVGGLNSYGFDQMLDVYKLAYSCDGQATSLKDKFISKFKSYKDLTNYAKSVEDNELLAKIDLVNQHGVQIPEFIEIIKEKCKHPIALANVVFTTAHKSKGLEFDTVCLTDDYPIVPSIEYRQRRQVASEESNVMYVALTRAKRCLLLPDKLLRVLLAAQEKFEYPMLPQDVLLESPNVQCVNCADTFTPHTKLVLVRRKIVTATGRVIQGGALCVKCGTEPTIRPRVQIEPVIMYLDPTADYAHRSMSAFVGPLPSDPPLIHDSFGAFHEMDVLYVINLNM